MSSLLFPPVIILAIVAVGVRWMDRRWGHGIAAVALAGFVAWTAIVPDGTGWRVAFLDLELVLVAVDDVSRFVGVVFGSFGFLAVVFAAGTSPCRRRLATGVGVIAASLVVVFAGDWFTVALGWTAFVLLTTVLVSRSGGRAVRAAYGFGLAGAVAVGLLFAGIAAQSVVNGSPGGTLHITEAGITAGIPAMTVGLAVAIGVGAVGLHMWLSGIVSTPHPVTSVILCGYTTTTAAYVAHRAFPEGLLVLAYLGALMAVFGALLGLLQRDVRSILASQIQAQTGVVLVGFGVGSVTGIAGGFAHLLTLVAGLGLAFVAVGLLVDGETDRLDRLSIDGFVSSSRSVKPGKVTGTTVLVAGLTVAGAPGFVGFHSLGLVLAAVDTIGSTTVRWALLVAAAGTAATFTKLLHVGFLDTDPWDTGPWDTCSCDTDPCDTGPCDTGPCDTGPWRTDQSDEKPSSRNTVTTRTTSNGRPSIGVISLGVLGAFTVVCVVLGIRGGFLVDVLPHAVEGTGLYSRRRGLESIVTVVFGVGGYAAFRRTILARAGGGIDSVLVDVGLHLAALATGSIVQLSALSASASRKGTRIVGRCVRDPSGVVADLLPDRWQARYLERRAGWLGSTGTKPGIEGSVYLLVALLVLLIVIGLR